MPLVHLPPFAVATIGIEQREYTVGEGDVFVEVCAISMGAALDRLIPLRLFTSADSASGGY